MARYRTIDVRMWGDARFMALSKPQPNAQTLWLYLLTGPHTTSIPGLSVAGEAMLAESLGWSTKAFREAFQEVFREGMVEADFRSRVLWIPKSVFYNPPASPNVVKSWRPYWDEVPECALKSKAYKHLKAFTEGLGEGFGKAFTKALPKDIGESGTGTGTVTGIPPNPPSGGAIAIPVPDSIPDELNTPEFMVAWHEWKAERAAKRIRPYTPRGEREQWKRLAKHGEKKAIAAIRESIAQGWQGIFPEKVGKNGTRQSATDYARDTLLDALGATP